MRIWRFALATLIFATLSLLTLSGSDTPGSAHTLGFAVDLVAQNSSKCLNVLNNSTADGAGVVQNTCDLRLSERLWITNQSDGYHTIQFAHTNKCMDLAGAGFNWGTQFVQWPCNGQDNQRFSGVFVADPPAIEQHRVKHSQLCVDVNQASSAENAAIIQWECLNQTNQQFKTRGLHAGTFTGYAMGNLVNGSGTEITQGMFANHSSQYCAGDPASSWPFGTTIQTMNAQTGFHNGTTGAALIFSSFFLEDIGDLTCSLGNYWADLYFGRYKLAAQPCSCPGSPSGTCYNGAVNQCTDAQNYGSHASTIYARN